MLAAAVRSGKVTLTIRRRPRRAAPPPVPPERQSSMPESISQYSVHGLPHYSSTSVTSLPVDESPGCYDNGAYDDSGLFMGTAGSCDDVFSESMTGSHVSSASKFPSLSSSSIQGPYSPSMIRHQRTALLSSYDDDPYSVDKVRTQSTSAVEEEVNWNASPTPTTTTATLRSGRGTPSSCLSQSLDNLGENAYLSNLRNMSSRENIYTHSFDKMNDPERKVHLRKREFDGLSPGTLYTPRSVMSSPTVQGKVRFHFFFLFGLSLFWGKKKEDSFEMIQVLLSLCLINQTGFVTVSTCMLFSSFESDYFTTLLWLWYLIHGQFNEGSHTHKQSQK